ncbi:hypothetical protein TWF706_004383 [Orbilia oligospora]|nr:hypothetical protein TWF706_004383 [Orbilia oligospora]
MEAVIRPQHGLLINFPGHYHKTDKTNKIDSKKSGEKKSRLRPSWLWPNRSNDSKSCSTEHKSETSCTADPKTSYPGPIAVQLVEEDFIASITKSAELVQSDIFPTTNGTHEKEHLQNQVGIMSPSSTVLFKILGTSSSWDRSPQNPQQQEHHLKQEYELEPKLSFTDRRKLNAKELRLELSRGYEDTDYNLNRSESFQKASTLSRDNSIRRSSENSENVNEEVAEYKQERAKAPSTPIHTSVAQSISSYLGSFGRLTPPSNSKKLREEEEARRIEELKRSIRHLTPPRTPQRPQDPPHQFPGPSDSPNLKQEWSPPRSFSNRHTRNSSTDSTASLSISIADDFSSDGAISPTNISRPIISVPQSSPELSPIATGLFENPRQFFPKPPRARRSAEETRTKNKELPLFQLASFAEPSFSSPSQVAYDVRDMVMPVVMIANALGFPHKASVNQRPENPSTTVSSVNHSQKNKADKPSKKASLKVKSTLGVFPRKTFTRSSSDSKIIKNNPYLHSSITQQATSSLSTQTYVEETQYSMASAVSSLENLQPISSITTNSAPVSAFDDDSSDDDYFGDFKNLSGLGTRNLRRRRTSLKRFSRDSMSLSTDRPFSRLSFSSKQDLLGFPKEIETRQMSTENFIPMRQIPIPEEAQLSTSAGTFNKARFGSSRVIRENEVHHLKDGDGCDHLVLEQEDGKILVVSGTLDCLMMELCASFETADDENFVDIFIRASILFTSPLFLLKRLTTHFRNVNSRVQERILAVIEKWLRTQPEDIFEAEATREILLIFLAEVSCWGHTQYAVRLTQAYSLMKDKLQNFQNAVEEAKKLNDSIENVASSSFPENLKLFFGDENIMLEVAQYLTAVDLILFRDASHTRTVSLWWISQTSEEQNSWSWECEVPYTDEASAGSVVERVNRLLRRSSNFKFWIQHEVLVMTKFEDRADLISSLIHLALLLRDQGNLQSCLVIVEALAVDTIISLEKTWDCVPIERIREFSELRALLDQSTYVSFFSQCKDFAIPYFPFFVKAVATILNQSTNASSRYSDASKIHVDSQIEASLYRPPTSPTSDKSSRQPPILLDFKKYRSFVKEASVYRAMTKYPPKFVWSLDRKCFVFRKMEIGRLAFPRDRDNASRATSRMRSGSITSIPEDTPDASYLNHLSEIIEGRIDTVLSPFLQSSPDDDLTKLQQFTKAMKSLRQQVHGEDLHC